MTSQAITIDTSQLPPAEAARLQAKRSQIDKTTTASATVDDLSHFTMTIHTKGKVDVIKAVDGIYEISTNRRPFLPVSSSAADQLLSLAQSQVSRSAALITNVADLGPYIAHGTKVERYRFTVPNRVISQTLGAVLAQLGKKLPAGFSQRQGRNTIDVNRATGFPVRATDTVSFGLNFGALHRPGLSGTVIINIATTRTYSDVRSHPLRAAAS